MNQKKKKMKKNYIHRERYTGKCSRSFYVGDSIKEEDIKAKYTDGILQIMVPKSNVREIEPKKYISID